MKKFITQPLYLKAFLLFFVLALCNTSWGQPWTYDFGSGTGSHTSTTASTSFLPTPTSGTARVRVGTNPGSIQMVNPGIAALGSATELQIASNTGSTSTTKFSIYDYTTGKTGYIKFKIAFSGGTNGVYKFSLGDGATFSDNNAMNTSQIFSGIEWSLGTSSTVTYKVLNAGTYGTTGISNSTTQFVQSTSTIYKVEIYANNTTSPTSYYRGGNSYSLTNATWDLWIDGSLVSAGLAKGSLGTDANFDSFSFNHQTSSTTPGILYLDDIEYSNSLPSTVTNYYSKGTGNLDVLANWGLNTDGSGTTPTDFSIYNQIFNIRNRSEATISALWNIDGSKAIIGDGTNACNFTIPASTTVTAAMDVSVSGTLTLGSSSVLAGGGNVFFKSNSSGSGILASAGSGSSITGNVTIERYIPAKRAWRLLTAPLRGNGSNVTLNAAWQNGGGAATPGEGVDLWSNTGGSGLQVGGGTSQTNIKSYTAGTGWANLANTNATNIVGTDGGGTTATNNAYAVFVTGAYGAGNIASSSAATTIKTTGKIVTGQQDFTVSNTASQFNLIGNPYPSPVDLDAFSPANANVTAAFYVWDPQVGTYGSYVLVTRTGSNTFTYAPDNSKEYRYIQSGQAFFTTSAGISTTVSFQESHKSSNTITSVFRNGNGSLEKLNVNISYKNPDASWQIADGLVAIYNNNYSVNTTDDFDAAKFTNANETVSLLRNGKYMAMEARPLIDDRDTMFLNLAQMRVYDYKFDFKPSNLQSSGLQAFLQDAYTNTETAISLSANSSYEFSVNNDAGSYASNRFKIVYRAVGTLPVKLTQVRAYQLQNNIQVDWTASSELNMDKYEVEKSTNGTQFNILNTVLAKNNNAAENKYSSVDIQPHAGASYYRIKSVSKTGEISYSEVVKVSIGKGKAEMLVYPNPAVGTNISITLNNVEKGKYTLKVWNDIGQETFNKTIEHDGNNGTQLLDISAWKKGIYRMVLVGEGKTIQQSVIRN